jgi:hypothetical protein
VVSVLNAAAGGPSTSIEQFKLLGVTGVNPNNLQALQNALRASKDDGTDADSLEELQKLVSQAQITKPPVLSTGLTAIIDAARDNNATEIKPSANDYTLAGVSGVDANNLAAINSALNTADVNGGSVGSPQDVQKLVDAYNKVLAAADGRDDNVAKPSQDDYTRLGLRGVDSPKKGELLGDVIDSKTKAEVDSAEELQDLANAVRWRRPQPG